MSDFSTAIIEEFRANDGQVGGGFAGAPMLLLHTTGAKSGLERVHPLQSALRAGRVQEQHRRAGEAAADLSVVGSELLDDGRAEVAHGEGATAAARA